MLLEDIESIYKKANELYFRRDFTSAYDSLDALPEEIQSSINVLIFKAELASALKKFEEAEGLLQRVKEALDDLEKRIKWFAIHLSEDERKLLGELLENYGKRLEAIERDIEEEKERANKDALLEQQLEELQRKLVQAQAQSREAELARQNLLLEIQKLKEEERKKAEELERAQSELSLLRASLDEKQQEIKRAAIEREEREHIIAKMESEILLLQDKANKAAKSQESLIKELEQLQALSRSKEEALQRANLQLMELQKILEQREREIETLEREKKKKKSKFRDCKWNCTSSRNKPGMRKGLRFN